MVSSMGRHLDAPGNGLAPYVTLHTSGSVARLTLNSVDNANSISPGFAAALTAAVTDVASDSCISVLIVDHLSPYFCTGASADFLGAPQPANVEPVLRSLAHVPVPVIAKLKGHAIGGGLVLGLYADFPVLCASAYYSANFVALGLAPSYGATWILANRFGPGVASELLYTGRRVRGSELADRGVAVPILEPGSLDGYVEDLAMQLSQHRPPLMRLLKRQLQTQLLESSDQAMRHEIGPHLTSWLNSRDDTAAAGAS